MIINSNIRVYGDINYRGPCPLEQSEQQTIVNQVRKRYPELLFTSVKNEGKRTKHQMDQDRSMGFLNGVSDLIFFGQPMLFLEMKRADHTKSTWQDGQQEFLIKMQDMGHVACVALGWEGAMQAVEDWIKITVANNK